MSRTCFLQAGLLALASLALFAARPAHAQLSFRLDTFDVPGQTPFAGSLAEGISASGNIAGTYVDTSFVEHGYIRSNTGNFTSFDYQIPVDPNDPSKGFRTDVNTRVITGGINSAGFVTGDVFTGSLLANNLQYVTDFIYNSNNGTFLSPHAQINGVDAGTTGLQNVNEAGIVGVEYSAAPGNASGPLHNASYNIATGAFTYYDDITGYDNAMQAVGPNGELLITLNGAAGGSHGSITRNGVTTQLDFPGAYGTSANAINANGLISGNYRDSAQNPFAFIYDSNNSNWYSIMYPGAVETRLFHGNSDTQFVGYYIDTDNVYHSLVVTAVPEPGSVALLVGLSVAGAGFLRRKTRKVRAC